MSECLLRFDEMSVDALQVAHEATHESDWQGFEEVDDFVVVASQPRQVLTAVAHHHTSAD